MKAIGYMIARKTTIGIVRSFLAEGANKGRAPTVRAKSAEVIAKFNADQRPTESAKFVGTGRGSVYRILNDAGLV